ncbi:hypothetical protein FACS1894164_03880 [Spirochaetia bacterium]|nr:hypothetical protein FACS1894164_03880 [Spirochaetia bacterium]
MKENKHHTAIPEQVITQISDALTTIQTLLEPYAIALTPQERHSLLKMGDKSLAFVEKCHEFIHENPLLAPSYLDLALFDVDFADAHGLWGIQNKVRQLQETLDDTVMIAGSEAFHAALAFYNNVQRAAKQDVPGAKAIYENLKSRFPGGRRKRGSDETDIETETE